jgi:hypothetical protein
VTLSSPGPGRLAYDAPEEVPDELLAEAGRHKAELLELLPPPSNPAQPGEPGVATLTISGRPYHYLRRWTDQVVGDPTADSFLSFDTETELIPDDPAAGPPRLALASAASGGLAAVIHPDDIGRFVLTHRHLHWIGHNVAFDFWVLARHLCERGEDGALAAWWAVVEGGRLHDSMLLDMLVRLARTDDFPEPRNLAVVAREYADLSISKDDPYRLRYAEVIGKDWAGVEPGFFSYAAKDAIVTAAAYRELRACAQELAAAFGGNDVLPDAELRFGLMSETVQVRKAIALAALERQGVHIDLGRVGAVAAGLRARLDAAVAETRAICPGLLKVGKDGRPVYSKKSGTPARSNKALDEQLAKVREEIRTQAGVTVSVPLTKKARLPSRSAKFWAEYAELHPFLAAWIEAEAVTKLLQFCGQLRQGRVHPRYTVMVRTGRTSASGPNIQQIPRGGGFRQMFVPRPGHLLLTADYSFIELRTLAAVCEHRFGKSKLADVIRAGIDPHAHTAAMMLGMPAEEFLAWKADPARKKQYEAGRQAAKAVNFGVPGGLGAASLAAYARRTYGVALTVEEAAQKRWRLIHEIYPELAWYLSEDAHAILARNLGVTVEEARRGLGDLHLSCVYKVLAGDPVRKDGTPYRRAFVRRVWAALAGLGLGDARAGPALARRVCQAGVATLTGRIRGRVPYSAVRNTPFQGLAADGAALALFALVREGYRVVGFVHDEVLIELPDEGGYVGEEKVRQVEEIMVREMEKATPGIPIGVESALSRRWDKRAKLVVEDGKVFPWEPPAEEPPAPVPACTGPAVPGGLWEQAGLTESLEEGVVATVLQPRSEPDEERREDQRQPGHPSAG